MKIILLRSVYSPTSFMLSWWRSIVPALLKAFFLFYSLPSAVIGGSGDAEDFFKGKTSSSSIPPFHRSPHCPSLYRGQFLITFLRWGSWPLGSKKYTFNTSETNSHYPGHPDNLFSNKNVQ